MAPVEHDQHLMIDERCLKKVVTAAKIKKTDTILEIGAGPGNLTRYLHSKAKHVTAIEIDSDFAEQLSLLRDKAKNVDIIFGNALDYLREDHPFDVFVANIPYAIGEALLQLLFRRQFRVAVLTVPTSFAEKVVGEATKIGFLSSIFFDRKIIFAVPRKAFMPEPSTDSVALQLTPRDGDRLLQLVFQQQDKKPVNAVREALIRESQERGEKMSKNKARERLKKLQTNRYSGIKISNLPLADLRLFARDIKTI